MTAHSFNRALGLIFCLTFKTQQRMIGGDVTVIRSHNCRTSFRVMSRKDGGADEEAEQLKIVVKGTHLFEEGKPGFS